MQIYLIFFLEGHYFLDIQYVLPDNFSIKVLQGLKYVHHTRVGLKQSSWKVHILQYTEINILDHFWKYDLNKPHLNIG